MRTKTAIRNSIISILSQIITLIVLFFSRRILIQYIGIEILGIDDVLVQMLQMLSLAELGVGSAITFHLYNPIYRNDTDSIVCIMKIYRFMYAIIGGIVFVAGLFLLPVIHLFIGKTNFSYVYIYRLYLLQLVSSSLSYFISYRRNLIYAYQNQYLCVISDMLFNVAGGILKIILAVNLYDYTYIILVQIIQMFMSNLVISKICIYKFPYLRKKTNQNKVRDKKIFRNIVNDTKNVFWGKIAAYIYGSTDNLVISYFMGVITVGLYSNYLYAVKAVSSLAASAVNAMVPSLGSFLCENKDKRISYDLLKGYTFIRYIIASVCCCGVYVGMTSMITIWIGKQYVLQNSVLKLMIIDIYIGIVHGPLGEYIAALGLFKEEKIATSLCAITNIFFSVLFVKLFGIEGVLVGTCIAQMVVWIAKYYILFHHYFKDWYFDYWRLMLRYIFIIIMNIFIVTNILKLITFKNDYVEFILSCMIGIVISLSLNFIFNFRTIEFKFVYKIIENLFKKEKLK